MTNHWIDIKNADVVVVMGGNAAENHPVGFGWVTEAMQHNNAKLVVVDPRFNRSAAVADHYARLRSGTDIAFFLGLIRYLIETNQVNFDYVKTFTNASFIVRKDFDYQDGLFCGYDPKTKHYDTESWFYELDNDGFAKVDPSLTHPRCVWNLLKKHVDRYTIDKVINITGTPKAQYEQVCEIIGATHANNKVATFLYALGWTQHTKGAQNIRSMAMVQLLLGNMGQLGGGVNALRGHSNIQGITDLGLLCQNLPGYLKLPSDKDVDLKSHLKHHTPAALRPGQTNYWSNYPKFFVSLMKSFWGDKATKENSFGYDWLPKWDQQYDVLKYFEMMKHGQVNGYIVQGFNILNSLPNKAKVTDALSHLKYMVVLDPLAVESATFWRNKKLFNEVDTAKIQTQVFRLPTGCFAEEEGTIVNSGRWMQWHYKAAKAPSAALSDGEIWSGILAELKKLYAAEGGVLPEAVEAINWNYTSTSNPSSIELAKELNGTDLKTGKQLSSFAELKDDGSTVSGCWIYTGSWTEAGNMMDRRDNADPSGKGITPNWAFAWPLNRRILYNRASADANGQPWDKDRTLMQWVNGKWKGIDVPDFNAKLDPQASAKTGFLMNPEGVSRLFCTRLMVDGPFPEHYEPFETPIGTNPMHPEVVQNPAARIFKDDAAQIGDYHDFPYVATTYHLTEHFNNWTTHSRLNAIAQPQHFIEMDEELAKQKGINNDDWVKITSKRGFIVTKALVTKRIQPMMVNGKKVHTIGIPTHANYEGLTRKAYEVNTLTPVVGDANAQTPEYKAFLVNIEKAEGL